MIKMLGSSSCNQALPHINSDYIWLLNNDRIDLFHPIINYGCKQNGPGFHQLLNTDLTIQIQGSRVSKKHLPVISCRSGLLLNELFKQTPTSFYNDDIDLPNKLNDTKETYLLPRYPSIEAYQQNRTLLIQ